MNQEPRGLSSRETQLLGEAQQWRLVALLFERPREGWWSEVAQLAESCGDVDLATAALASCEAREGEYHALFGPGGCISPREAGYRKTTDPSKLLAEIRAHYEAFQFEPATEEPIDHVAVEAGFVGWMKLKEAYARAGGDSASAEITAAAAQRFVERHLATMAEPLLDGLMGLGGEHWIGPARSLVDRTGPRPSDVEGGWVPESLACGDGFTCGGAAGCASRSGDASSELEDTFDLHP